VSRRKTPAREGDLIVETLTKSETRVPVKKGSRITDSASALTTDKAAKPPKKKVVANQPKAAPATKAGKSVRPPRSSRVASEMKKLVCRYCSSDDLAPSFVKRRDARCRTCFKQRYGSAVRNTKAKPTRLGKAGK
jgi:hypothetical protein